MALKANVKNSIYDSMLFNCDILTLFRFYLDGLQVKDGDSQKETTRLRMWHPYVHPLT